MSILLGKSVDFVVLRRHLNRCGFMNEHVSIFVSQPGGWGLLGRLLDHLPSGLRNDPGSWHRTVDGPFIT
jgi:hypothetical protein